MRRTSSILAGLALFLALPAAASAQSDLGDVLGTTILQNTLTTIGLPQINVPSIDDPTAEQPTTEQPATTQQPAAPAQPAHAPGYYCRAESKKHLRGSRGTPFSQCVAAMAKLQNGETTSAADACRSMSRKRVKGMRRTPYSACIAAGRQLLIDKQA